MTNGFYFILLKISYSERKSVLKILNIFNTKSKKIPLKLEMCKNVLMEFSFITYTYAFIYVHTVANTHMAYMNA